MFHGHQKYNVGVAGSSGKAARKLRTLRFFFKGTKFRRDVLLSTGELLLCLSAVTVAVVPKVMIEMQFDQCLCEGRLHDQPMVACEKVGPQEKGQSNAKTHNDWGL